MLSFFFGGEHIHFSTTRKQVVDKTKAAIFFKIGDIAEDKLYWITRQVQTDY